MFELDGVQYSLEELQSAAERYELSFEEYMEKMQAKGMVEVQPEPQEFEDPFTQDTKKEIGPVEEAAVVGPEQPTQQPDTDLVSEDISLELPKGNDYEQKLNRAKEALKATELKPEEIAEIENKALETQMVEERELIYDPKLDRMIEGGNIIKTVEEPIYKDFIPDAKKQLALNKGIDILAVPEPEWNELAKEMWIDTQKQKALEARQEEVLEEYEDDVFGSWYSWARLKKFARMGSPLAPPTEEEIEYSIGRAEITEEFKEEALKASEDFDSTMKSLDTHAQILNTTDVNLSELEYKFNNNPASITQEDLNQYNDLLNTRKTTYDIYTNLYNELEKLQTKSNKFLQIADMTQRTYNNLDVISNRISGTSVRTIAGLGSLLYELTPQQVIKRLTGSDISTGAYVPMYLGGVNNYFASDEFKGGVDALYDQVEKIEQSTKKRQELGEVKNIEDFGEFMLDLFSEQAVNTAVTLGTGGAGLVAISAGAAGNKFNDMDLEMEFDPNVKISAGQFYSSGILYGAAEYITERVSLGQAKRAINYMGFGKNNFKKAYELAGSKYSLENFKLSKRALSYGINVNKEGGAEFFAQLMNNFTDKYILDKDISIASGLGEAYLTGAIMSGLGFQAPVLAQDIYKAFTTSPKQKAINERLGRIFELRKKIGDIQTNTKLADDTEAQSAINAMQQEIDNLIVENIKDKSEVDKRVDSLTNSDKRVLLDIEADTYKAKRGIDKINSNPNLDAPTKQSLIRENAQRIDNNEKAKDAILTKAQFSKTRKQANKIQQVAAAELGLDFDIIVGKNNKETLELGKEKIDASNLDKETKVKLKKELDTAVNEGGVNGFFMGAKDGLPLAFAVEDAAIENSAGSTILHEVGHGTVLKKLLDNNADMVELANVLESYMTKNYKQAKQIFKQVEQNYSADEFSEADIAEEKLAAALEYINDIDVSKDTTLRNKLWQQWQKIKPPKQKGEITTIKTGKDVFDLLNSFVKGFNKGEFSGLSKKVLEGKVKAIEKKAKEVSKGITKFSLPKATEFTSENKKDLFSSVNKTFNEAAEIYGLDIRLNDDGAPNFTEEQWNALDENTKLGLGYIIGESWKPYVNYLMQARRDVPGFDELAPQIVDRTSTGIEKGDNGVPFLVKTYNPAKGTKLTTHIFGQVGRRLQGVVEKTPGFGEIAVEAVPTEPRTRQLVAEEVTVEETQERVAKEKPRYVKIKDSKVFSNDVIVKAKDKVLQTVRTLKNKLNTAVSKNVNTTPIIKEFVQSVAKQLDIDIKKAMGGKEGKKLRNWTIKNKKAIVENATTTWLMGKDSGKDVKGGMPIAIEKQVDGKFLRYPDWIGKKIDRETTEGRGQTAGLEIVRRVPADQIDDTEFANFVTTEDGTPIRGRKESLAKELAGEIGVEIFAEELDNNESEIAQAFEQNQELRGEVLADNYIAELNKQFERGKIKFSKKQKAIEAIRVASAQPFLTTQLVNAWNQPTIAKRKAAIKKIMNDLDPIYKGDAEVILNDLEGGTNFTQGVYQRAAFVAEDNALQSVYRLAQLNKDLLVIDPKTNKPVKSLKAARKVLGGSDATIPDLLVQYKGATIPIEIKSIKTAFLGSTNMSDYFNIPDDITLIKNPKTKSDFINNIYYNLKNNKKYKDRIKFFKSIGIDVTKSNLRITEDQLAQIKNEYGSIYKATDFYDFDLPVEYVYEHYKNKKYSVNYLNYADIGMVSLGNNPLGWKIPQLKGKLKAKVSSWKALENADGTYNLIPRLQPELSTEASNAIAEKTTESVYSIASFNNLLKNTNIGTLEAVKNTKLSKGLKKQYEQQQDYLISLTKAELDKKDIFDMRQVVARQMFPKEAMSDAVVAGMTTSFEALTDAQKKKVLAKVPGMVKFSKKKKVNLNSEFNKIIERASGISARKRLSGVVARRIGANKGMFKLFLPPSAEDFRGLYYSLLGSGRQGEADKEFFKDHVVAPYTRGIAAMEKAKQAIMNDFKALRKIFRPDLKAAGIQSMNQKVPGMDISVDQAVRIYLWTQSDKTIPELTEIDQRKAVEYIYKTPILQAYANGLLAISKQDSWSDPTEYWDAQTTLSDLTDIALNVNRKFYLKEFIENTEQIFSPDNLNKIEATLGKGARQSFEDILYRMRTGSNRPSGSDSIVNKWNNWVNNSVGAIMFFNRRSATLQLLSTVNFLNYTDNHPLRAAAAFANFPQYIKDWTTIFNSPKLKERRGGLKSDVQEAEIAAAAKNAKNKPLAMISYLLKIGFTPTKIADSFAIATGGAAFYRNRINTYKKKGFDNVEAEAKAWEDFSNISDETQQSGDPMLISKQQAGSMGRLILAFQNTPMQITRFQKRDFQDLINRRRIKGKNQFQSDMTYLSRITYYTAIQNLIFSTLQNGLFTLLPGFDDEDEENLTAEELDKIERKEEQKVQNVLNSMLDTTLRGSGLYGAVASTIKNVLIEYMRQQEKDPFQKDNAKILLQAINISPPIGSKARKFYNSLEAMDYERDVLEARGFGVMIDGKFQLSPAYQVLGNLASATINLPLDRAVAEIDAVTEALDARNSDMQRIAMALGWKAWEVGAEVEEHELINTTAKETRALEATRKRKEQAAAKRQKEIDAIQAMSQEEINAYANWKSKPENKGKRLLDYLEENK